MTKWAVSMPSISAAAALLEAVEAVKAQTRETEVLVVMNGSAVADACAQLESNGMAEIYRPYFNLGCSASWNHAARWAWEKGYDKVFLMNDDFILTDHEALERMETYIEEYPDSICHYHGFSAVCITKRHYDLIGPFDEGYWPAYFEDNDYVSQARPHGIDDKLFDVDKFKHYGSLSLRTSAWLNMINMRTFEMNKQRYIHKWGGEPHKETFLYPWNGGEPTYGEVKELLKAQGWENWYQ